MENKNMLLAVILSVGFLFVWSNYVMPRYFPQAARKAETQATSSAAPSAPGAESPQMRPAHTERALPEAILRDQQNEIVFSPQGGGVKHWRLKLKAHEIDLVANPNVIPLPLAADSDAVFKIHQTPALGAAESDSVSGSLVMGGVLPSGLKLTKTLVLSKDGFLHDLVFRFDNPTAHPIEMPDWSWGWGPGLGTAETERKENSGLIRALSMGKLKVHALKPGDYSEFGSWAGIDNRYFLVAFLPADPSPLSLSVTGTKAQTEIMIHQKINLPPGGTMTSKFQIYVGPKGYTQLGRYHRQLEEAVDFGFFSPVGKVVLRAVYWLQRQTGNYGWAIIILTICLQIILFPLTIKSTKAQQAMKRLQPQIAELQKNYKSDPKRLNIEMMNLYKKSGTNPFGGCLPMVLQLPIFWALFTTLRNAYELRGAPFIGWIHDLSVADPYHVLPLVMGGAMFFQQRMSGAVTDPTQKQMMIMMPIVFTVMFFNFPAGLVLYWLTNNLLTMAIQWGLMRADRKKALSLSVIS